MSLFILAGAPDRSQYISDIENCFLSDIIPFVYLPSNWLSCHGKAVATKIQPQIERVPFVTPKLKFPSMSNINIYALKFDIATFEFEKERQS